MSTEKQYNFLEVPEVVPNAAPTDFPEISEYLKNMKIKGSLFGFQKEDVYTKMQELNQLYQQRVQQMREQSKGQIRQMHRQHQEELDAVGSLHEQEKTELETALAERTGEREALETALAERTQELQELQELKGQLEAVLAEKEQELAKMKEELVHAKIQIREDLERTNRQAAEKRRQGLLGIRDDLSRMVEHLGQLKGRVGGVAREEQDKKRS